MQKVEFCVIGLACASIELYPAAHPHRHFEVELTFIEEGALVYFFGGRSIVLQAGQLAVFWAAIPHGVVETRGRTVMHWLTIPLNDLLQWPLAGAFMQLIMDGQMVIDREGACSHFDQRVFERWRDDLSKNSVALQEVILLEVEACLRRLALAVSPDLQLVQPHVTNISNIEWRRAKQATTFIAQRYNKPISVGDVAQELGLHPQSVMRLFQKTFGIGVVEYVTQYRLAHAQRLLVTTDASIVEIAIASGFGSVSRFYAAFTQAFGRSPGTYRQTLPSSTPLD